MKRSNDKWLKKYNEERLHDALGDMTPREFLLSQQPEISTRVVLNSGHLQSSRRHGAKH